MAAAADEEVAEVVGAEATMAEVVVATVTLIRAIVRATEAAVVITTEVVITTLDMVALAMVTREAAVDTMAEAAGTREVDGTKAAAVEAMVVDKEVWEAVVMAEAAAADMEVVGTTRAVVAQ